VGEVLAQYTGARIMDKEFDRERTLSNGWTLNVG
jgi:hypothetical protein